MKYNYLIKNMSIQLIYPKKLLLLKIKKQKKKKVIHQINVVTIL